MECFLDPRRVRTLFKCVSFGAVLLWILLGAYVRQEADPQSAAAAAVAEEGALGRGWPARHLLSASEGEVLQGSKQCQDLGMYYEETNVMVDLNEDQVRVPLSPLKLSEQA